MYQNLKKVFFRLNSPYVWGEGMSESSHEVFKKEALEILKKLDFHIAQDGSRSFSCPEGVRGEENLYMHPMDFSGILSEENYLKAKQIIEFAALESSIFSIRTIDVYEIEDHHVKYIVSNLKKSEEFA
jgi:hypothetical protein